MTHVRTVLSHSSKVFVALLALAFVFSSTLMAQADGTAANKLGAAGSTMEVFGPGERVLLLDETLKVSSVRDLILQVSSECSILTALATNNDQQQADSSGQIRMWIEIDGKPVPVSEDDEGDGRVVFCNRTYERRVTDQEDPEDGIDAEDDYIRTRTANAFNWVALDSGTFYDNPTNGNNILDIRLYAELTESASCEEGEPILGQTCAQAIVGNRSLVIENTNAQNTEVVTETDPNPAPPTEEPEPNPLCAISCLKD